MENTHGGVLLSVKLVAEGIHCVKTVRIRSFTGPCSARKQENAEQKNSEYGHFSRSGHYGEFTCVSLTDM